MGDREARALGAGSTIAVNGKDYRLAPITMKLLHELQREALRSYKRQYLQTFVDNVEMLPEGMLEKKMEQVARWDVASLPSHTAYSAVSVPITDELEKRLRELFGEELPESTTGKQALLSTALDQGNITAKEVTELAGVAPKSGRVPYDMWWVTATHEGQITFVWASLQQNHPTLTRDEVGRWPIQKIMEAARLVETITTPDLGNI